MPKIIKARAAKKEVDSIVIEKLPGYFLIFCLVVVIGFLMNILKPFWTVIFLGGVLTVSFYPIYKKFLKWFKYKRLSSFLSCLLVVLVIVAPLAFFVLLLTSEAYDTYLVIDSKIESGVFDKYLQWEDGGYFYDLKRDIQPIVDLDTIDIKKNVVDVAQSLSSFLVSQTTTLAKGISSVLLSIVVMLFVMYYFFKDGPQILKKIGLWSPLPEVYENELFKKIASMIKAVVLGVFLTAILQGVVGGVGFAFAGISNPVFWGTAMAFFSLVPVVGTALIWVPTSIVLVILGSYGAALFVFLWGILAVSSVDNFVRPYLIGGKAHAYPLMTFLVVLGGVMTMGLKGVIIGPLILIMLLSFLHIYEAEYKRVLKR